MTYAPTPLLPELPCGRRSPVLPAKAVIAKPTSNETVWEVQSLDSLRLPSAGLALSKKQLDQLPSSLRGEVYAGFSRLIQKANHLDTEVLNSMKFSVADHHLVLQTDCGQVIGQVRFDPKMEATLAKVIDRAQIHFPNAFRGARTVDGLTAADGEKGKIDRKLDFICESTNAISVARNGMNTQKALIAPTSQLAGRLTLAAGSLGVSGGLLSVYIGKRIFDHGKAQFQKSNAMGDGQGMIDGASTAGIGGSFGVAGTTMVAGYLPDIVTPLKTTFLTAPDVTAAVGAIGNLSIVVMGASMLINSSHGLYRVRQFRKELLKVLDNKTLSDQEKARQGITFLSQRIYVTKGELHELEAKHFGDPKALKSACEQLAKIKWARFVKQVGQDCASRVASEIKGLDAGLNAGEEAATAKAIELLKVVDKENHKIRTKLRIQFFLSFLYLAVGFLSFWPPTAFIVPLLFAIGAGIFLFIDSADVHRAVSGQIYDWTFSPKKRWLDPAIKPLLVANGPNGRLAFSHFHPAALKKKVSEVLRKAKQVKLKVVQPNGEAKALDSVENFAQLCAALKLKESIFEKEMMELSELSQEQIRAIQFLEALKKGIATAEERFAIDMKLDSLKGWMILDLLFHEASQHIVAAV